MKELEDRVDRDKERENKILEWLVIKVAYPKGFVLYYMYVV